MYSSDGRSDYFREILEDFQRRNFMLLISFANYLQTLDGRSFPLLIISYTGQNPRLWNSIFQGHSRLRRYTENEKKIIRDFGHFGEI